MFIKLYLNGSYCINEGFITFIATITVLPYFALCWSLKDRMAHMCVPTLNLIEMKHDLCNMNNAGATEI